MLLTRIQEIAPRLEDRSCCVRFSELVRDVEAAGWKIREIRDRRFHALRTIALWQQNLDRIYGDCDPPGQLGVLRSLVNAALPSPVRWCQSFPLIDIVAD